MADESLHTTDPQASPAGPGLPRRALRGLVRAAEAARRNPLWLAFLVAGSSVLLAAGLSLGYWVWQRQTLGAEPPTVERALAYLDAGDDEAAREVALELSRRIGARYRGQGPVLFVLGSTLAREAAVHQDPTEQKTLYLVAGRYLQQARDRGFPVGRGSEGQYQLAMCLFRAGQYAESLVELQRALEAAPRHRYPLYRALAAAYLLDTRPQLERAAEYLHLALENPALTQDERWALLIEQSKIELAAGERAAAVRSLEQIPPDANLDGQQTLMRARVLIEDARHLASSDAGTDGDLTAALHARYKQAIELLRRAQTQDSSGTTTRQARYLLGVCYRGLRNDRAAEQEFARTRRTHYKTPDALAARLAEAEIQLRQKRYEVAVQSLLEVVHDAGSPDTYSNPWVPLPQLRERLEVAHAALREAGRFPAALRLSRALRTLLPAERAVEAAAQTHVAWAESYERQAAAADLATADVHRAEARAQYRRASRAFGELAELRFATRHYPDDLWHSARCMLQGQNYAYAVALLQRYLEVAARDQQARGLIGLGTAYLALNRFEEARATLLDCLDRHPRHPENYRGRLLASHACEQLGELDEAKKLLEANLYHKALNTRSVHWLASKFTLGEMLYREAMAHEAHSRDPAATARQTELTDLQRAYDCFQEAIVQLEEAVQREQLQAARSPRATRARYLVAEAWLRSARLPRRALETAPTQARRNVLRGQMDNCLIEAAQTFHALRLDLKDEQERNQGELTPVEQKVLRNSYFGYADALFDRGEFDQAIKAYSAAANRYQHEPTAIEAFMQIASCYRHLEQPDGARATLLQAAAVLSWIREDADFTRTTRYDRANWNELITWLSRW